MQLIPYEKDLTELDINLDLTLKTSKCSPNTNDSKSSTLSFQLFYVYTFTWKHILLTSISFLAIFLDMWVIYFITSHSAAFIGSNRKKNDWAMIGSCDLVACSCSRRSRPTELDNAKSVIMSHVLTPAPFKPQESVTSYTNPLRGSRVYCLALEAQLFREMSTGDLRWLVVTQIPVEDHQLTLMWKNYNNNN